MKSALQMMNRFVMTGQAIFTSANVQDMQDEHAQEDAFLYGDGMAWTSLPISPQSCLEPCLYPCVDIKQ